MIIKRVILKLNKNTTETGRLYTKPVIEKMIKEYFNKTNQLISLYYEDLFYSSYISLRLVYGKVISLRIIKDSLVARIKIFNGSNVPSGEKVFNLLKNKVKLKFSPIMMVQTITEDGNVKLCFLLNIHPMVNDEFIK